jgi:hypothetical protein
MKDKTLVNFGGNMDSVLDLMLGKLPFGIGVVVIVLVSSIILIAATIFCIYLVIKKESKIAKLFIAIAMLMSYFLIIGTAYDFYQNEDNWSVFLCWLIGVVIEVATIIGLFSIGVKIFGLVIHKSEVRNLHR